LVQYGSIRELTKGGLSGESEGKSNSKNKQYP